LKAVLIGEARGSQEELIGYGFVGTSGQELARMGGEAGLFPPFEIPCRYCHKLVTFGRCEHCGVFNKVSNADMVNFWQKTREESKVAITNVFHVHPVKDNIELFFGHKGDDVCLELPPYRRGSSNFYVLKSHEHFVHRLHEELESLSPNVVIPLGNTACWATLAASGIKNIRGTVRTTISPPGLKALPTYHPAALRDWSLRGTIVADLKKAARESVASHISREPRWIWINPSLAEIKAWFATPCARYACDIESGQALFTRSELKNMTPGQRYFLASQISMVGFANLSDTALVIPFMTRDNPTLNYWTTEAEEVEAWGWVQYGLSSGAELVFQNGLYDINRLLCYGMRPKNAIHDTMLLHHSHYPEMLKGLGYLGSLYTNDISWKEMFGRGDTLKRDE
jgi:uracil-DNA glycosylase